MPQIFKVTSSQAHQASGKKEMGLDIFEKLVFNGSIKEGYPLSERKLLNMMSEFNPGISPYDVKSALIILSHTNILEQTPRSRTIVNRFDDNEKKYYFDERKNAESKAVKELIKRLNDCKNENEESELMLPITKSIIDMKNAFSDLLNPDLSALFQADLAFHTGIADASGNKGASRYIRELYLFTFLTTQSRILFDNNAVEIVLMERGQFIEDHNKVLQPIMDKNEEAAENAICSHIDDAEAFWEAAIAKANAEIVARRSRYPVPPL